MASIQEVVRALHRNIQYVDPADAETVEEWLGELESAPDIQSEPEPEPVAPEPVAPTPKAPAVKKGTSNA